MRAFAPSNNISKTRLNEFESIPETAGTTRGYDRQIERPRRSVGLSDPLSVAMALRNDYLRLQELRYVASRIDEQESLEASIRKRAKAIQCPENYGEEQARLESSYSFFKYGVSRSRSEDPIEDALSIARLLAYDESTETQARQRIFELERHQFSRHLDSTEENELNDLKTRYPDLPPDPYDPLAKSFEAWGRAAKEHENR